MSKYGAVRTTIQGITFASKKEATRYQDLHLLEQAGVISGLECQPRYKLVVNGQTIGTYVADFRYHEADGRIVVEDTKGVRTPVYRLKQKLMRALYQIEIYET